MRAHGRRDDHGHRAGRHLVDIPTKRAVFIQADYLKDSEFDVVETDVEKIAEHARMKQGA